MCCEVLTHSDVLSNMPDRDPDSHKGNYGRVLLLCGSRGYTGAAALAAMGALRCGSGLVYLGVPESIYDIEAVKLTEPIVFPLPDENGMFHRSVMDHLRPLLQKMDAVLIGPGIGQSDECAEVVIAILKEYPGTVILDADGINVLKQNIDVLRGRDGQTILTPHAGEFARIGGCIDCDRISAAAKLAVKLNSIVLLKGNQTVITDGKTTYLNTTGNPGMAVGGCGDVLAGMITAFVGQGIDPLIAAACGAWVHGKAGDICAEKMGQYGMLPSDMLMEIPRLLK